MTLVICPECEAEVELEKRYCPNCTAPIPPNAMHAPDRTVPVNTTIKTGRSIPLGSVANKSRRLALILAIASVFVIFSVVAVVLYQSHRQEDAAVMTPLTLTPTVGGAQRVTVPADVQLYLTFLKGVEQSRADLRSGLPAAAAALAPMPPAPEAAPTMAPAPAAAPTPTTPSTPTQSSTSAPPASAATTGAAPAAVPPSNSPASPPTPAPPTPAPAGPVLADQTAAPNPDFTAYTKKWLDLIKQFNGEKPPDNCQVLNNDYYRLLQDYSSMLDQMSTLPSPTADGINGIEQGKASQIHEDALVAANALKSLCDSYGVNAPFTIDPDLTPVPPAQH